jgi:hypothetical protein
MTTSLTELPLNLEKNNSSMTANEISTTHPSSSSSPSPSSQISQETISQLINGLQSSAGATQLQSRDIPQTTHHIVQDPTTQVNYIPGVEFKDYIKDETENKDIILNDYKETKFNKKIDDIYDELNQPILIAVLYFIFQLPFFKTFLNAYLPILFSNDYNYNFYGYVVSSLIFSMIFYLIINILKRFD